MKLVVGLGNPGKKYKDNRHNVGFVVVDRLVKELRVGGYGLQQEWKKSTKGKLQYIWFDVKGKRLELIKPQIFMNDSGFSVAYAYKNHPELKDDNVYIIHDDLDINLGDYKIQKKGPREHKGFLSVYKSLGTKDFWHVRIGIENRDKMSKVPARRRYASSVADGKGQMSKVPPGEEYVLQDFTPEETVVIKEVIDKIIKELINELTK
jgi:PTH1 family peptidyl-tRNA hydrolase